MEKLIIFASGTKDGGGSGFQKLVENTKTGILQAEIVVVVSNHKQGGVRRKAEALNIPFIHFPKPWAAQQYQEIVKAHKAQWVALSGWLKLTAGLDPKRTINIHPGPLPKFGGAGMYRYHVHEAIIEAFERGEIKNSAVSMHFVTEAYDEGPIFFQYPVLIRQNDTAETLATRVNKIEHAWQSYITNLVIQKRITWDGKNPDSLKAPPDYPFLPKNINIYLNH